MWTGGGFKSDSVKKAKGILSIQSMRLEASWHIIRDNTGSKRKILPFEIPVVHVGENIPLIPILMSLFILSLR